MTTTLYTAALVVPVTAPPIVDGAVAVKDGRILHVGVRRWVAATLAERGLGDRFAQGGDFDFGCHSLPRHPSEGWGRFVTTRPQLSLG